MKRQIISRALSQILKHEIQCHCTIYWLKSILYLAIICTVSLICNMYQKDTKILIFFLFFLINICTRALPIPQFKTKTSPKWRIVGKLFHLIFDFAVTTSEKVKKIILWIYSHILEYVAINLDHILSEKVESFVGNPWRANCSLPQNTNFVFGGHFETPKCK